MCHGDRFQTRATEDEPTAVTDTTDEIETDESPERDRGEVPRPTTSTLAAPLRAFRRVRAALSR
ncbi:hypothetical protein [Halorientalis sp.]|jgi:hypothetical protein|uniref:hypothetical protein n=1 Tax=Halorientalis sp. TaxID=1931229 RepID=UPI00261767C1|nr:hypothetical protein [Halorientalis sp.]